MLGNYCISIHHMTCPQLSILSTRNWSLKQQHCVSLAKASLSYNWSDLYFVSKARHVLMVIILWECRKNILLNQDSGLQHAKLPKRGVDISATLHLMTKNSWFSVNDSWLYSEFTVINTCIWLFFDNFGTAFQIPLTFVQPIIFSFFKVES